VGEGWLPRSLPAILGPARGLRPYLFSRVIKGVMAGARPGKAQEEETPGFGGLGMPLLLVMAASTYPSPGLASSADALPAPRDSTLRPAEAQSLSVGGRALLARRSRTGWCLEQAFADT
jgi:hypothetical protein